MAVTPLALPPGMYRNGTAALSAGRFYSGNLVRWVGGSLQPIGGWQKINSTAMSTAARAMLPWLDSLATQRLAVATDSRLLIYSADTVFDATPAGLVLPDSTITTTGYGSNTYGNWDYGVGRPVSGSVGLSLAARPYSFSLDNFGQNLIFLTSADGRLFTYSPATPSTAAAVVATAPTGNRAAIVTAERHVFLLGLGGNPRRFGWCSQEDITDWNFASTTNTAGFLDIDSEGILITARNVREGVLLFTESDVWLARYVGTPFIYNVERIGYADGPISPAAIAEFSGRCAWMGRRGFWYYEGGYVKPLASEIQDYVFSDIDPTAGKFRACASDNGVFAEVWFHYPSTGQGENDKYVIWNYEENWWAYGTMGRTARCPAGVYPYPLAAGTDLNIYYHENGWTANGLSRAGQVYAETGVLSLGERLTHMLQLQADSARNPTATKFTIYGSNTPDGSQSTFGPYTPRADGYTDVRCQLRELRLRIEQTDDADWTIGRMYVHGKPGGRR